MFNKKLSAMEERMKEKFQASSSAAKVSGCWVLFQAQYLSIVIVGPVAGKGLPTPQPSPTTTPQAQAVEAAKKEAREELAQRTAVLTAKYDEEKGAIEEKLRTTQESQVEPTYSKTKNRRIKSNETK